MKLPSLNALLLTAATTFKRFPLAICSAIIASLVFLITIHFSGETEAYRQDHYNVIMASYVGMLLFIAVSIFAERKNFTNLTLFLMRLGAILLLVVYYFSLPEQFMRISFTRFVLFVLALHLVVAFIPFLVRNEINGFWQYNKNLFLKFLTSALYTIVLYLGLILAIYAIDELFRVNIDDNIYGDTWVILAGIFNTWFFLAGVPKHFSQLESKTDYPKGLKLFTQYVLIPLITIYILILYAYMFRIIITAEWPEGWVVYLVTGFSIGGILSLLLIYPVRNDEGNKWILLFSRVFYFALIPLIILLFLAIRKRITDYGITEERYLVLAIAIWLLFISIYFLISKKKNIKVIPVSLCVVTLLITFGPWSVFNVSLKNQQARLEKLLSQNIMLMDGKAVKAKDTIPFKENKQISSIIEYLVEGHGHETIQPYFSQNLDSLFREKDSTDMVRDYEKINIIHSFLNIPRISKWQTEPESVRNFYRNYHTQSSYGITIGKEFDYLILEYNVQSYENAPNLNEYAFGNEKLKISFNQNQNVITVNSSNNPSDSLSFNMNLFLKKLNSLNESNLMDAEELTLIGFNNVLKAKIIFENISFRVKNDKWEQVDFNASIFIDVK